MQNKHKSVFWVIIVFIAVFGFYFLYKNQKIEQKMMENDEKAQKIQKILKIGENFLNIEVASTTEAREKGLSGKERLDYKEGMLFVFDTEGYYGFWMKDMKFNIDISWLDKDKKIIFMKKNVSPDTYPEVFYAQKADLPILSLYVLETAANFLDNNNIKIGDLVAF